MAEVYPIRLYGDPILRKRARPVEDFSIIPELAENMFETMFEARGVGLAAPQIGLSLRLFVAAQYREEEEEGEELKSRVEELYVFVNPVIKFQEGEEAGLEGCLSIPGLYSDEVPRGQRLRVEYQDEHGLPRVLEAEGYLARVIQHEYDHLNGVLFFQRLPPSLREEFLTEHREALTEMQRKAREYLKREKAKEP